MCAGYTYFNGQISQISVMGDDLTTDEIDGYQIGQDFEFIIWDGDQNISVQGIFTESSIGFYETNGLSFLESIISTQDNSYEQQIDLPLGWSFFSTYILEDNMEVAHILEPIVSNITIVKNNDGDAYLPDFDFNGIGDFLIGQGYQVKTNDQCNIILQGNLTFSNSYPTFLREGWNLIGYLKLESSPAETILADLVEQENLIIAKDDNGYAYLPQWNFNGIGNFNPGKGYQLKVYFETHFSY